jgi:hypothetical protein
MIARQHSGDEVVRLGRERYERDLRKQLEPEHKGKYLALDIETGEFEIDVTDIVAVQRIKAKHPGAVVFLVRIGYPTAYKLGLATQGGCP